MNTLVAVFFVGCSALALAAGAEAPSGHFQALQERVQTNSKFAKAVYLQLAKEIKGNIFFSPQSIHVILSLLAMGASGTTFSQMASALAFGGSREEVQAAYKELLQATNNKGNGSLQSGNLIAVEKTFSIKKEFFAAGQNFLAKVENLDFGSPTEAANIVNKFVANITRNKIKSIVNEGAFSDNSKVVLVNAVYFIGKWEHPFEKEATKKRDFYVTKLVKKPVEMMNVNSFFKYDRNNEIRATLVELPYKDSNLSFVIILPFDIDGLSKVEKDLENRSLESVFIQNFPFMCNITLPKFKIEKEMELQGTLSKIGMGNIFSISADFSGVSTTPLLVASVFHKAVIEVDEGGTVAAGATAVKMVAVSSIQIDIHNIVVDHPFLFAIRDTVTKAVLFMGRYSEPA